MTPLEPLIADKELIRLWYEFYLLALGSEDEEIQSAVSLGKNFYQEWAVLPGVRFDVWWRTHRQLFIDNRVVRLHPVGAARDDENIYLAVPRAKSLNALVGEFRALLGRELDHSSRRSSVPSHRYALSEVQGVKRDSLRFMLDLQRHVFCDDRLKGLALRMRVLKFFSSERFKKKPNSVPMAFVVNLNNTRSDHCEETDRNIRRYRQKARKLLLNVASGVFPGKY
jgi:hypothetical protein